MNHLNYFYYHTPHCSTCRCGVPVTTTSPTVMWTTPYAPKHRKPGPAQ